MKLSRGRPLAGGLMLALAAAAPASAAPPDWLAACLAEKNSPSGEAAMANVATRGGAAIELLHSTEVRFLAPDKIQTRRRVAVWVKAEPGRNRAPTAQAYNPDSERILAVKAWVASADGRRVRTYGRIDLIDSVAMYSKYFWNSERVIRLNPADKVELGGVVAWEVETESPWGVFCASCDFHSRYYVLRSDFEVSPAPGSTLLWHASSRTLESPIGGSSAGALRWTISRLAPFPVGQPSGFLVNPLEISVRCLPARSGAESVAQGWAEESRLVAGIVEPRMESGGAIKAEADRVVAGKAQRWDRIRALSEFVQRDVVYLSVTLDRDYLAGYRPHPASEVLHNRYGDCKDKADLLVSLLRAEGERAYMVALYAGNPAVVVPDWPSLVFNHAIVAIAADSSVPLGWPTVEAGGLGRVVIFDPTDSITPLGDLSPPDQGGYGLIVDAKNGSLARLPTADPAFSRLDRTIQARLAAGGAVQADVEEVLHGVRAAQAYGARFRSGASAYNRLLEARVHRVEPLAEDITWTDDWDPSSSRYRLSLHFRAGRYVRPVDESSVMITPQLLPVGSLLQPWTSRAEGVVWLPPGSTSEEVRLPFPEGYQVEEMPDPWHAQSGTASCGLSYGTNGRTIVYRTELRQPGGFYTKQEYEALRAFYLNLHEAQRRPILFRRAGAASDGRQSAAAQRAAPTIPASL